MHAEDERPPNENSHAYHFSFTNNGCEKELSSQIGGTLVTTFGDIIASNLRYSRDSRETFVRLSHDVRQNIA